MLNKSKLWALALLLATFAAGAATGGAVSAALGDATDGARRDGRRLSYAERLQHELSLSAAQRESLDTIMERRKSAMQDLWREVAPGFDSLRTQIRAEITELLDTAQQEQFQALIAHSDSVRAAREQRRGGERGR